MSKKIKLIHTGDLHLGVENYGKNVDNLPVNTRVIDFLQSFDYIVSFAIDKDVDLFLIAGDIYEQREPSIYIQNEFSRRIIRLLEANIPIVLLIGNHDSLATIKRISSLQIFRELKIPDIYVIDEPSVVKINTKSGVVQVAGLPYIEKSRLKEFFKNFLIKDSDKSEATSAIIRKLIEILKESLEKEYPAILTAHLTLSEAIYQNWHPTIIGNELYVSLDTLKDNAFSYVALGHIHKPQSFNLKPEIAYCGSMETVDFGEANFDHGFIFLNIEKDGVEKEFIPIPGSRKFITISLEASKDSDFNTEIIRKLIERDAKNDVVRINLVVNDSTLSIDENEIYKNAAKYCFNLSSVKIERKRNKTTRISGLTSENSPIEALSKYIDSGTDSVVKENKKELIELTYNLLREIYEKK
jgi:exonuclease SbcD